MTHDSLTSGNKILSPLRQRMIDDMSLRKLSPKTQTGYVRAVKKLTHYLGRSPDKVTAEDLRLFQLHLVSTDTSSITLNATITGLKFFYGVTLDRLEVMSKMSYVHEPRRLPLVMSVEEVKKLLDAVASLKYKAALSVAYGAGLRASEVTHLKVIDIDSKRMLIRVEQGTAWRQNQAGHISLNQLKVMSAIEKCRTAELGGHVLHCDQCQQVQISYNSCRNHHCPKCQSKAAKRWLDLRMSDLLPVDYYHVVFTLPSEISDLAYSNQGVMYNILFKAASETLLTIAADPKHLGAKLGITMVLHTWCVFRRS